MNTINHINQMQLFHNKWLYYFDYLQIPPLYTYLTVQDVTELHRIATSNALSADVEKKYKLINEIMIARGFRKFACGTNRVIYRHLDDTRFLIKVAIDEVGLKDNPSEYLHQQYFKPFVTKIFEVSPCGTVASVERVEPIISSDEFYDACYDIYKLITKVLIGKYILDDIGCDYFMNYGIRVGFGPVLLDFPYVFEIDGKKLYCNKKLGMENNAPRCDGVIDYDAGFNNLVCTKCGKKYVASELQRQKENKNIIIKEGVNQIMSRIKLIRGDEVVFDSGLTSDTIKPKEEFKKTTKSKIVKPKLGKKEIIPKIENPTPVLEDLSTTQKEPVKKISIDKPKETSSNISLEAFGLTDADFEEPKEESKSKDEYYNDSYDDVETFEKFTKKKKKASKNIIDEF